MGAPRPVPSTVPELLARNARDRGDVRALVTPERSITHRELDDASRGLAGRFVAAGVGRGDRVGLSGPNGIEWAVTAVAVLRLGAVLVPLSTLLRPTELLDQLDLADVTHLVISDELRGRRPLDELVAARFGIAPLMRATGADGVAPVGALRAIWSFGEMPTEHATSGVVEDAGRAVRPDDDMTILFTSGSSGPPKGVVHSHRAALGAVAAGLDARCVGRDEVLYLPMPFFWAGGLAGGLFTALVAGATLLTEAVPDPVTTLAMLERERVTLFRGWPDQATQLAAQPGFDDVDLSALSDASLPGVLPAARRPEPGARPNLFGMTETFGPYCGDRLDRDLPEDEWGSCGRPFDGVEVRIVDPATGEICAPGEHGEIQVRGPALFTRICGRQTSVLLTDDGFYRTGDIGHRDSDGYLWYSGRLDDMVKVRGATVYPSEVERALRAVDGVTAAHATGVEVDGSVEIGALVVTPRSAADVEADLRERLSAFKVPTRWVTVPDQASVPLRASGKIDRDGLRELLVAASFPISGSG